MSNLTAISPPEQISFPSISSAVSQHLLSEFEANREDGGAGLAAIADQAVLEAINYAFSVAAQAHASAVLGVERSVRAGARSRYRLGTRTVRVGGPLGVMDNTLVKSRRGLLRPKFLRDAKRFTEGVKQVAVRLWTHGLSYRSIADISQQALKTEVGRSTVGSWVQQAEADVSAWLHRPVPGDIRYLMLDGMFVSKKRIIARSEPVLTAIGITDSGARHVLAILAAPNESIDSWTACL